ncbi:CsbD family protein [Ferrovibrio xuzhouensis]
MRKIAIAAASALAILAAVPVIAAPAYAESATWLKIEGNWNQFAGKVKQQWGKLTDDDLTTIKGHRQELVGKIQERYGIAKAEAEKQVDAWEKTQKVN